MVRRKAVGEWFERIINLVYVYVFVGLAMVSQGFDPAIGSSYVSDGGRERTEGQW